MVVGLFGGSFNPAHAGHVHLAETARKRLGLDRVLWLVSPGNPLKDRADWGEYEQRVASALAITARLPNQLVCESEMAFGTRYSLDTLLGFVARWPGVRFVWLIGADNLRHFHLWRDWQQIAELVPIAVLARPGDPIKARLSRFARQYATARLPEDAARGLATRSAPAWVYLNAPYNELSSTALRGIDA
ncbi:MAG: nicotinic acid mononucleotide adenylyltransferase [Robiginitomaculum sp.]|nr:MAG: nicotinic acid mononucleotide adenylyltransferase [Robiginitomaculum sp.]